MLEPVRQGDRGLLPNLSGNTIGRFLIRERLGQGGMGEVYRAEDSILRRPVAIKRITPELSADEQYRSRLMKEAEAASSLSNEHVAVVHDVLEERGSMFLVMEYVEGETLRQRAETPLSLEEFYAIGRQCIEGIAAAHRKGILHCDIKPENIMIGAGGQVKILDFGLAKQLPKDSDATLDQVAPTSSGSFSGTPAYMAPEVLLEKPADARSDIFSLGVVFYEVLARRHPFRADSFIGTSDRILHEEPGPIGYGVPAHVEDLVLKMLAKEPAERPADAEELLREFDLVREGVAPKVGVTWQRFRRRLRQSPKSLYGAAAAAVLLVIMAAAIIAGKVPSLLRPSAVQVPLPPMRQLAVLPFESNDADLSARAYGLGLTETVTSRLAELSAGLPLQVVAPGDIRAQSVRSAEQAKIQFGANLVLEGTMAQSGSTVRVHYRLVNPEDRRIVRAGMIAGDVKDPFDLEDRVVQGVLRSLEVELAKGATVASTLAQGSRPEQPEAYDLYLRGRGYLQEYDKPESIENAIQAFQRALVKDPQYARAYAGLGESYRQKYDHTHEPQWMARGEEYCRKAAASAPALPDGHACLGIIATHTGKYESAVEEFRQALKLDPRHETSQLELALALERLGRFDEAEGAYKSAIEARPQYWSPHNRLGRFYLVRGRYPEAIHQFEQVITLAPDSFRGHSNLGAALLMTGKYAEAVPRLEKSFALRPNAAAGNNLGAAYFYLRRYEEAARTYEKASGLDPKDYTIVGNTAEAYYWSPNRREEALARYRQARTMARRELETNPRREIPLRAVALYSAMLGDRSTAVEFDRRAREASGKESRDPEASLSSAIIHAQIGDRAKAFHYLQEALDRGLTADRIERTPNFDALRNDPKMKALVTRTK